MSELLVELASLVHLGLLAVRVQLEQQVQLVQTDYRAALVQLVIQALRVNKGLLVAQDLLGCLARQERRVLVVLLEQLDLLGLPVLQVVLEYLDQQAQPG